MSQKDTANAYYASIAPGPEPQRFADIASAIAAHGWWEEKVEWRISTVRISRIERSNVNGHRTFRLSVSCGHHFECHCPTLERAVYFEAIYSRLVSDLFYNLGWPSWAAAGRLNAQPGETAAT